MVTSACTSSSRVSGFTVVWAYFGQIDLVAVAPGKVIAADKTKVIQPAETAIPER